MNRTKIDLSNLHKPLALVMRGACAAALFKVIDLRSGSLAINEVSPTRMTCGLCGKISIIVIHAHLGTFVQIYARVKQKQASYCNKCIGG